ncbi:MAG: HAD family hydrolase [Lactobacillaceae bacterium]|jgi:HAD superfamily hydrolase (TIGR01549 family)|nr:HAD family hydrolase [Lactobacillaceae bacterium]
MPYKNIVFDYDGTLADSTNLIVNSVQATFEAQNFDAPTPADIIQYIGTPLTNFLPKLAPRELSELELTTMVNNYRKTSKSSENSESIKLFSGIADLLTDLTNQDINLFILTSKNTEIARRNTAVLDITDKFKAIIGADMVAKPKPNPAGLLKLVNDYNLVPTETLMVGDTTFDIQMANAANIDNVAVTWGAHDLPTLERANPTYIASDVSQLADNILS